MSKPQQDQPPAYSGPAQPQAAYQGAVAYPEGHQQLQYQQGPYGGPAPENGGYYQPNPNMGYYQPQQQGYPPQQGGYYQQGPYGQQPQGGYYGQPGGYYGQPQGRYQNQSSSSGCLEGVLAGLACCCCLDLLF